MIVRKIKTSIKGKNRLYQIGDLVDYIRHPHDRNPEEKIIHAGSRNFLTDTHVGQKHEMITLACESKYSEMPVSHWVFSWPEDEIPSRVQVDEMVDIFLEQMGLVGHQAIYGLHGNTQNIHLHIAVNRMNENTGLVVRTNNGFDIKQAHKALAVIENRFGWKPQNKTMYKVVDGELVLQAKRKTLQPSQRAQTFEQHTGAKSAERIAQEKAHAIIRTAKTWEALHQKLAPLGIRYIKKGSGAIIEVDGIPVKASSVDRTFALGKMQKRLGEFVAGKEEEATHPRPPEPVSPVNIEEWHQYQNEMARHDNSALREQERQALEEKRRQLDADARKKLVGIDSLIRQHGHFMGIIARHAIKEEREKKLATLWREHRKSRKKLASRPTFKEWLLQRGQKQKADAWRYRHLIEQLACPETLPPTYAVKENCPQLLAFMEYDKAVAADRYRVTSIKFESNGEKKAFVLDKRDGISQGFTSAELINRMNEMLDLQKRRENLYYTPLSKDRHHILVDDMTQDRLSRLLHDGFKPCLVLKSSANNYQCLLTYPRLDYAYDREIANRITRELNQKYGDPKLSGAVHAHRAPAFLNLKDKYRTQNGLYPVVMTHFAQRRDCKAVQSMSWRLQQEMSKAREERQKEMRQRAAHVQSCSATEAYYAHYDNIREIYSGDNMDLSRVDAMIAVRMRANGHSQADIESAIAQCAPTIRDRQDVRQHRWHDYAARTANYAFSMAGDIALHRHESQRRNWERVEEEVRRRFGQQEIQSSMLRMK